MNNFYRFVLMFVVAVISACASNDDSDLRAYITSVKARPAGPIDPVPSFRPYEAFNYGAMLLRSPFDRPVVELQQLLRSAGKKIQPDLNREREHLENYSVSVLKMVGTIEKNSTLWALISDDQGGVHRVRQGNYIGRNHGHIVSISQAQIEFMEVVSDGLNGWIERPRSLRIEEKE